MKYLIIILFLCSCTVTHRLERKQYNATVQHIPKEERVETKKEAEETPKFLELKCDSGSFFFVPPQLVDSFMQMRITIDDVIVRSTSRLLPERNGKVNVDFIITLPRQLQGNCQNVVVTPNLHKPTENVPLEDLTIRGKLFSDVQRRNYWQYERYRAVFNPDSIGAIVAYEKFVKYPYPQAVRLDSVIETRNNISYYYTQEVKVTDDSKKFLITLGGKVVALDGSLYKLPKSDTLTYNISSMLTFIDTTTRYMRKIIEKYAVVNDRKFLSFKVNKTTIIDTLGDNRNQLNDIDRLMNALIRQKEFHVDSIILTASASPEGSFQKNTTLAKERAQSLKKYLGKELEKLITVKHIPEDWEELIRLIKSDTILTNKTAILEIIAMVTNPDKREQALHKFSEYNYLKDRLYPKLRAVNFKYDLRRVGMIKDTIHTSEIDTLYGKGVELLKERKYPQALYLLESYKDRNTVIALMSLSHDKQAFEILQTLHESAITFYLKAILCSRLGMKTQGQDYFLKACNLDPNMEYRGNLDPEISDLLKI